MLLQAVYIVMMFLALCVMAIVILCVFSSAQPEALSVPVAIEEGVLPSPVSTPAVDDSSPYGPAAQQASPLADERRAPGIYGE